VNHTQDTIKTCNIPLHIQNSFVGRGLNGWNGERMEKDGEKDGEKGEKGEKAKKREKRGRNLLGKETVCTVESIV
jgi:hypothetical protein